MAGTVMTSCASSAVAAETGAETLVWPEGRCRGHRNERDQGRAGDDDAGLAGVMTRRSRALMCPMEPIPTAN